MPPTPLANSFAEAALAEVPKLLMLQDRNPHSPTYGCFDRNYWQYRRTDFPTGMAQEFVYPLALAYRLEAESNAYRGDPALKDWIEAGIRFAALSSHRDGACDDFFPFERASGAAAFSLLGCMQAYDLLDLDDPELESFFATRGRWLAAHQESGQLSNHEALIVYCLYLLWTRFGVDDLESAYRARLERLLSWQDEEGWFQEYEGCDLGYQTLTIGLLAQLYEASGEESLRQPLERAISMTASFMHPDGSLGGEVSSRNTYNYFPHGFELAGKWFPAALALNDRFGQALQSGRAPCYSDDHMVAHHLWSYLLAAANCLTERDGDTEASPSQIHFPGAGLLAVRDGDQDLFVALNKGGVFKLFRDGDLVFSDTQLSFKLADGRTAVCHMIDEYDIDIGDGVLTVSGRAGFAKQKVMRPVDNLLLRGFMFVFGRFFPTLVRKLLQRLLITDKRPAPFEFSRRLEWGGENFTVQDEVKSDRWADVVSAGISGHQTSISVVQSRPYHESQHQAWFDVTDQVKQLDAGEPFKIERSY